MPDANLSTKEKSSSPPKYFTLPSPVRLVPVSKNKGDEGSSKTEEKPEEKRNNSARFRAYSEVSYRQAEMLFKRMGNCSTANEGEHKEISEKKISEKILNNKGKINPESFEKDEGLGIIIAIFVYAMNENNTLIMSSIFESLIDFFNQNIEKNYNVLFKFISEVLGAIGQDQENKIEQETKITFYQLFESIDSKTNENEVEVTSKIRCALEANSEFLKCFLLSELSSLANPPSAANTGGVGHERSLTPVEEEISENEPEEGTCLLGPAKPVASLNFNATVGSPPVSTKEKPEEKLKEKFDEAVNAYYQSRGLHSEKNKEPQRERIIQCIGEYLLAFDQNAAKQKRTNALNRLYQALTTLKNREKYSCKSWLGQRPNQFQSLDSEDTETKIQELGYLTTCIAFAAAYFKIDHSYDSNPRFCCNFRFFSVFTTSRVVPMLNNFNTILYCRLDELRVDQGTLTFNV